MSIEFAARFSPSRVPLALLLERLAASLPACGLHPAIDFGDIDQIAKQVAGTGGWNRDLQSTVLYDGLGNTDAIEVNLRIFRVAHGLLSVVYDEVGRATDHRIENEDAARNLNAIQLAICDAGRFELSLYGEKNVKRPPIPTLRNIEVAIERIADEPTRGDCSAVVSTKVLDLERARRLAGPRAAEIVVSPNGYIVFPFLRPAPR